MVTPDDPASRPLPASVRVAAVQFQARAIARVEDFEARLAYWTGVAADYAADFVLFPELFAMETLSVGGAALPPPAAMAQADAYAPRLRERLRQLAVERGINIIGGSHPMRDADGKLCNVTTVALRDGRLHDQAKLHATPSERGFWGIAGGAGTAMIETDCGPVGVMICYDSEFPELARRLVDEGALILFVPYCTEDRRGHLRIRYCCQARAVENQCHVVTAGLVGNLAHVGNMDAHYAESAILTPSDFPFARDGIAAEAPAGTETIIVADLSLDALRAARAGGAVRNLADRRADLYRVAWNQP